MADAEIQSFEGIWNGGYYEGDPLNPHGLSHYYAIDVPNGYPERPQDIPAKELGFVSILYATYLTAIRKRLPENAVVLEIGPGRGGWTKALLTENPSKIYALDALSAAHNGFWQHVGIAAPVEYWQIDDFDCTPVPDKSIDFFFSFGVFCHISRRGTAAYFDAIARKMKSGSQGFCMISDYEKLGIALAVEVSTVEHQEPEPGRWYHLGTQWFCDMLEQRGFKILDRDTGVLARDPIVYFQRL